MASSAPELVEHHHERILECDQIEDPVEEAMPLLVPVSVETV